MGSVQIREQKSIVFLRHKLVTFKMPFMSSSNVSEFSPRRFNPNRHGMVPPHNCL